MSKLLYIFLLILLYSCNQDKKESYLNGFDVSPDIRNIVFAYKEDLLYYVYTKPINNGKSSVIFKGSGNYVNPKYINNGKTIVALYYPRNELVPEFHFYDIISHKITDKIKVDDGLSLIIRFHYLIKYFIYKGKIFNHILQLLQKLITILTFMN